MIRVGVLVYDGVTMLDVSGPAEAFSRVRPSAYELTYFSPQGGEVRTSSGMVLAGTVRATDMAGVDTVVVPGADDLVDRAPAAELLAATAHVATNARRVAAVCTGAFLLAELGMLDGRRAATHWNAAGELARRYPGVRVEPDTIRARDDRYFTSAGITAGIDLALALVEDDLGVHVARELARELVVFLQRPGGQAQFSSGADSSGLASNTLQPAIASVMSDPTADHSVPAMAARASISTRHLTRLFRQELGTTPSKWLESVRLDVAREHILAGETVTHAARLSGFGSDESLRRAFIAHLRTTPTDYRARFASSGGGRASDTA